MAMQMQISSVDSPYNLRLMMIWIQMNTDELTITAAEIAEGTKKDSLLVKVYECTSSGWSSSCASPELRPFWIVETRFFGKRMSLMGQTCHHTIQIPKTLIGRVTRVPSRDVPYQSTCQVL